MCGKLPWYTSRSTFDDGLFEIWIVENLFLEEDMVFMRNLQKQKIEYYYRFVL